MRLELALFEVDPGAGIRLLGRLEDPDLVGVVRDRLAQMHSRQLADLAPGLRLLPKISEPEE